MDACTWSNRAEPIELTADTIEAAFRNFIAELGKPPIVCGSEERPHLIHPNQYVKGNRVYCLNCDGEFVV